MAFKSRNFRVGIIYCLIYKICPIFLELIIPLLSLHLHVLNTILECKGEKLTFEILYHKLLLRLYFIPQNNGGKCLLPTFPCS